mmetsp:Transcript_14629/g.22889  ORF Transcript_14629/g.22889 Transcript_14629/m.22889 type:complete len:195 (-) Transcript_14629:35-619(-)
MCKDCCEVLYVDRGETVHESGSYLVNFQKCAQCGVRTMIQNKNEESEGNEDEDDEYEITFDHHCSKCGHKICQHFYSYRLDDGYHKYLMECALCGRGAHEQLVGVKQMYPQQILDMVQQTERNKHNENGRQNETESKEDEHEEEEEEEEDNNVQDKGKRVVLNLSAMQQLNSETVDAGNGGTENNEVAEDEWDD